MIKIAIEQRIATDIRKTDLLFNNFAINKFSRVLPSPQYHM